LLFGNKINKSTLVLFLKASSAADPVSPLVAPTIKIFFFFCHFNNLIHTNLFD